MAIPFFRIVWTPVSVVATTLLATAAYAQQASTLVRPGDSAAEYRPGGYPELYTSAGRSFYPATELRALPTARAQAVAAKAEFQRSQMALNNAVYDVRRVYTRSDQLNDAIAEERAAWDELKAANKAALTELQSDPRYQAAVELRQRLASQIEQTREQPGMTAERLLAMATVKLSFSAGATAMEAAALSADPSVNAARKRLIAAGKTLTRLREDFEDAVRADTRVLAARKSLDDAKINLAAADATYIEATRVADAALDFAYLVQKTPVPSIINTPDLYGGSYAYGGRLPVGYPYVWTGSFRR